MDIKHISIRYIYMPIKNLDIYPSGVYQHMLVSVRKVKNKNEEEMQMNE